MLEMYAGTELGHVYTSAVAELLAGTGNSVFVTAPRGMKTAEFATPVSMSLEANVFPAILLKDRRLNPFFAVFEALWMWGLGARDTTRIGVFNSKYKQYSDDGEVFHGAYGWRLRRQWGFDQIQEAIELLRKDTDTRRCVLSIWDPPADLNAESKDIPCNTTVIFRKRTRFCDDFLDCTVLRRSNDIILGLPHNLIQFWFLHNLVAQSVGMTAGVTTHVINSLHLYLDSSGYKLNDLCSNAGKVIVAPAPVLTWNNVRCTYSEFQVLSRALFAGITNDNIFPRGLLYVAPHAGMWTNLIGPLMIAWNVYAELCKAVGSRVESDVLSCVHGVKFNDIRFLIADFIFNSNLFKDCSRYKDGDVWSIFETEAQI